MSDVHLAHESNAITSNVLTLGTAKLAGVVGEGMVRVRRDLNGAVFEILGTWRLPPDATLPPALRRAQDEATLVTYDGPLDDSSEPTHHQISAKVRLDGIHLYQRSVEEAGRNGGHARGRTVGNDATGVAASRAPIVLIHFTLEAKSLPYSVVLTERAAAEAFVATHARNSRQTVPVLASANGDGLPPLDATLDGVLGGSWQMKDDGTFLWYSTPAESKMAFSELYSNAQHLVNGEPVELSIWPEGTPYASTSRAGDDPSDEPEDVGMVPTSGIAPRRRAHNTDQPRSFKVVIDDVGRSADANYVVAHGTVR